MCDMAVASSSATFGLPEVKIGMFPMQVGAVIQHLIPRRKLMEMALTGEPITAEEALQMDLVNYVVPPAELDAKVDWLLERICNKSPTAVRRGRHAMAAIVDMNVNQALDYMALQLSTLALTQDSAEGLAAFREKRVPKWTGK
jgi:enoyl-CoA hydratase/carnithine racemase